MNTPQQTSPTNEQIASQLEEIRNLLDKAAAESAKQAALNTARHEALLAAEKQRKASAERADLWKELRIGLVSLVEVYGKVIIATGLASAGLAAAVHLVARNK